MEANLAIETGFLLSTMAFQNYYTRTDHPVMQRCLVSAGRMKLMDRLLTGLKMDVVQPWANYIPWRDDHLGWAGLAYRNLNSGAEAEVILQLSFYVYDSLGNRHDFTINSQKQRTMYRIRGIYLWKAI